MSVPSYNNTQVDVRMPAIYNPSEVIGLFSEALAKRSDGVIIVRGIYHPGRGISYNGYFFDILKEEFSNRELTIIVPPKCVPSSAKGTLWS